MRKSMILPFVTAVLMTVCAAGCDAPPVEQAQDRVDTGKVLAANQNAALIFQNAENYSAQCGMMGVTVQPGRYCGRLDTGATTCAYTGDTADFEAAQNTFTNGSTGGYFCVMVGSSGQPEAAYWCGSADLSQEQFPAMSEPFKVSADKIIGRYPEGAEPER